MAKRLIKVAKELNVGTSTIVEFLTRNGFEIDDKPIAKVTGEMEAKLYEEFQESVAIKEKADQLIIGTRPSAKKETVVVAPPPPPPPPIIEKKTPPPIIKEVLPEEIPVVKVELPPPPVVKEVPKKKEVEKLRLSTPEQPRLKVLGKINLDAKRSSKPKEQEQPVKATEKKVSTPPVEPKKVEKVEPPIVEPTPAPQAVVKKEPAVPPAPLVVKKEEVVAQKPVEKIQDIPKAVQPPAQATENKEVAKEVVKEVRKEEAPKSAPPQTKPSEQKVVQKQNRERGKIQKPLSPSEKSHIERNKKQQQKQQLKNSRRQENRQQPPSASPARNKTEKSAKPVEFNVDDVVSERPETKPSEIIKPIVKKDDVIRAEAPKLKGTKILGKIELSKFDRRKSDKSKPVASSDTSRTRKRKRTRKKVEGGNSNAGNRTSNTNNSGNRSSSGGTGGNRTGGNRTGGSGQGGTNRPSGGNRQGQGGTNRPSGGNSRQGQAGGRSSTSRSGGNRPGGNNRSRPPVRGRGRRDEVKEVSQKEIEDKIKSTMARLEGGGGRKRQKIRRDKRENMRKKEELQELENKNVKLQLTEFISVSELASLMDVSITDIITTCMNLGVIVSINQRLDAEIIELLAEEYGNEVEFISAEEQILEEEEIIDAPEDLLPRAPIVTVMGHVDHGKTSLLDYIRKATVADGEAGGITQHIGAYEVLLGEENDKKKITFLDTPGHEAFTAMRARGAKVTDIAVIIIAADDSLMPQTKEAISHAQAAGVPIIFAINKVDKAGASPDRIKQELSGMNLLVEEWGGEYQSQDISAKTGQNVDALLEEILLRAEMLELKANPNRASVGVVLEASLDKGRGYVAKTLVQNGTLSIGDPMVAGSHSGKVKAMFNEKGKRIKKAGPSTPVLVLGLSGAPQAGEKFKIMGTEQEARQIASKREQITREQTNRASKRISLDEIGRRLALGNFKELNLIVKGDVDGSIEALSDALIKQSIESVQVNIIHKAVGQIIESDVLLASASDAIIIGFQVRPSLGARKLAEREGVQIKMYSIIYEAIDEIRSAIEGMLEPTKEEKLLGEAEVREIFKISKVGTIAGCYVQDGKITRNAHIRLIRNGIVQFPQKEGVHGEINSLKRIKDDAKEVKSGFECGITIKNYNDIKVGDVIEAYEIVEVKQTLQTVGKRK